MLLFSFFVEAAQVTKALADSTLIGSSNLTRNVEQNSVYSFQAEQCFAQVCLEDDNRDYSGRRTVNDILVSTDL